MMIGRRVVNSASARTNVSGILSFSRHHIIEQGIMQRHGSDLLVMISVGQATTIEIDATVLFFMRISQPLLPAVLPLWY